MFVRFCISILHKLYESNNNNKKKSQGIHLMHGKFINFPDKNLFCHCNECVKRELNHKSLRTKNDF